MKKEKDSSESIMTSKQRSKLKSIAANLSPVTQIGKGGISGNLIRSLSQALEARELIKVTVLKNSETEAEELIRELAEATFSEPVQVIGNKVVLYRRSERKNFEHIL